MGPMFFITNIGLGISLAMDAFSVSLANGLNEPKMKSRKMCGIAGVFAIFQALMPFIGWICLHTILQYFSALEALIPWIALILLCFIGGKMIYDGAHPSCDMDGNCTCSKFRCNHRISSWFCKRWNYRVITSNRINNGC